MFIILLVLFFYILYDIFVKHKLFYSYFSQCRNKLKTHQQSNKKKCIIIWPLGYKRNNPTMDVRNKIINNDLLTKMTNCISKKYENCSIFIAIPNQSVLYILRLAERLNVSFFFFSFYMDLHYSTFRLFSGQKWPNNK